MTSILFFLALAGSGADSPSSSLEEPWKAWLERKVLPPGEGGAMMARFLAASSQPLPLPASAAAWRAGVDGLRREVLTALGIEELVPPKWELNVAGKGVLRREGYRIEKLTFESYPGMAVPALLYLPDLPPAASRQSPAGLPGPGVVSIAGHAYATGKATEDLQKRNANLALRGCVVLAYDYIDTGERNTGPDPFHGKPYGGGNSHGISSFSFSRRTPTGLEVLDAIRALDLLTGRPEVDPRRLGFTGESGAGNTTYWIAALDPRVKLAVPVSSVTTFDYWIRNDRNWDWHQRPPGIRRIADIGTLLALHAPEPLLVISSLRRTDDEEFPFEEAVRSVAWAQEVYRLLEAPESIALVESTTGHGFQEDKRRELYRWIERWLKPPSLRGDVDLPVTVDSFEDLRCGLPVQNRTSRDIYAEWLEPLPRPPALPDAGAERGLREFLRGRLGLADPLPEVRARKDGGEEREGVAAEFWLVEPEPGIRLPCVLIGRKDAGGPIVLVPGRSPEAVARALAAGHRALAFDPRGTGEMADGGGPVRNWAWFAGRPWPGMWAMDLLQAARFCREHFPGAEVEVDAAAPYGWPALLAGAAVPGLIHSGAITLHFTSLKDLLRDQGDAALSDVPGLLERLDIPQLRQLWPETKLILSR